MYVSRFLQLEVSFVCLHGRWTLTWILDVKECGLGPGSVPSQRRGPDSYCVVPRMHHFQFAATSLFVHVPRHTVVQLLQENNAKVYTGSNKKGTAVYECYCLNSTVHPVRSFVSTSTADKT